MKHAPSLARNRYRQRGLAALEFALVAMIFFTLFFIIVEVARALYVCNTLQEVTRRGAALAAHADFSSENALNDVRAQAVFRANAGPLFLADPITDKNVKIDYLSIQAGAGVPTPISGSAPKSPLQNRANCTNNPNAENCIQLVRVRICQANSDADCERVQYKSLVSLVPFTFLLPRATTIVRAESLGLFAELP